MLHQISAVFPIGGNALDAAKGQRVDALGKHLQRLENIESDKRFHDIELKLSSLSGHGHGEIVADDLIGNLVHHFGNDGVYFARHDGGPGSHRRQIDLVQSRSRSTAEQSQIVANLGDFYGNSFENAGEQDKGPHVGGCLHEIGSRHEFDTRDTGKFLRGQTRVFRFGSDAGTDGSCSQVDFPEEFDGIVNALNVLFDGHPKALKLLAESHRHGILKLRATHFNNIGELDGLLFQFIGQFAHCLGDRFITH